MQQRIYCKLDLEMNVNSDQPQVWPPKGIQRGHCVLKELLTVNSMLPFCQHGVYRHILCAKHCFKQQEH